MRRRRRIALALLVGLAAPSARADEAAPDGRALFQGHLPFAAGRAATAAGLPPAFAACAGCHGDVANGRREGGAVAPPVSLAALLRPLGGEPAYASADAVAAAIAAGAGRGGRTLAPAMPRYRLSAAETAALLAYLGRVGTRADRPPGVTDTEVTLGTVLPLSGPAAVSGAAVQAGIARAVAEANAAGGVHGRRLVLATADAAADGAAAAVRTLLAQPVYTLVGGLWAQDAQAEAALAAARVSHIGSLVLRAQAATGWTAALIAPQAAQRAALAAGLRDCGRPALALALRPADATAAEDATEDATGEDAAGTRWLADVPALAAALRESGQAGCVGTGLARAAAVAVPPGWRRFAVLPFPAAVLEPAPDGAWPDRWHALGLAAGRLAVETLARAGPALTERSLLAHLPGLNGSAGYAPLPGVASLRFGPRRSAGWDAEVVELPVTPVPIPPPSADRRG